MERGELQVLAFAFTVGLGLVIAGPAVFLASAARSLTRCSRNFG